MSCSVELSMKNFQLGTRSIAKDLIRTEMVM